MLKITDEQIEQAFAGTNFGPNVSTPEQRRNFIAKACLKAVCDYSNGHTATHILHELGMTKKPYTQPIKAARQWAFQELFPPRL